MAIDERFEEQARAFITETIKQVVPTANVDGGSGINTIMGRGGAAITAALMQEIDHVQTTRDLSDVSALPAEDLDRILENLLTERDRGDRSFGFVRLYYDTREERQFAAGLIAKTEDDELNFVTLSDLEYEVADYFQDSDSDLYYINVPFVGEEPGDEYDVDAGEITKLSGDSTGPVRVSNISAFRNGVAEQTNEQALRKAQRSISTRTPVSTDGVIFYLQELFGTKLIDVLVIGAGDAEMLRDEMYDMGELADPRFQIGKDGTGGAALDVHVGGRTDVYSLFATVNFVQQVVDIFADMTMDTNVVATGTSVVATFITGTTGTVSTSGKLIIDTGEANEETVSYSSFTTPDNNTYTFTLETGLAFDHDAGTTVKAVNNSELSIAPDGDIDLLPVFQVSEVRLLDPITLEPIGDPLPETTEESTTPGWYLKDANQFDIYSARETKTLVVDEKKSGGNIALSGTGGTTADYGSLYTKYTDGSVDFTGYQGRTITLDNGGTIVGQIRVILQVLSATEVILQKDTGVAIPDSDTADFTIDDAFGDYNQYPVRVSYYTNTEIEEIQNFFDQDSQRSITSDSLSRSFLPTFIEFHMQYRGDGEPLDIRENILDILQTSSGEAIGESSGAKFDYSDLINSAYEGSLANYVQTPFEVKISRANIDGTFTTQWINPGPDTVNTLAHDGNLAAYSSFVPAKRPDSVKEFNVPSAGKLILGGFSGLSETLEYVQVIQDGDDYIFVLKEGVTNEYFNAANQSITVMAADYDPANVITDGVITDERDHRPFLGVSVIIENLDS